MANDDHDGHTSRYALQACPYRFDQALDPLWRGSAELSLFAATAGFEQRGKIDAEIKRAVGKFEPAIFVVTGRSGSGRSSVVNYILAEYCSACGIKDAKRLLVPQKGNSADSYSCLMDWFGSLADLVGLQGITLSVAAAASLATWPTVQTHTMRGQFAPIARNVGQSLVSP